MEITRLPHNIPPRLFDSSIAGATIERYSTCKGTLHGQQLLHPQSAQTGAAISMIAHNTQQAEAIWQRKAVEPLARLLRGTQFQPHQQLQPDK